MLENLLRPNKLRLALASVSVGAGMLFATLPAAAQVVIIQQQRTPVRYYERTFRSGSHIFGSPIPAPTTVDPYTGRASRGTYHYYPRTYYPRGSYDYGSYRHRRDRHYRYNDGGIIFSTPDVYIQFDD